MAALGFWGLVWQVAKAGAGGESEPGPKEAMTWLGSWEVPGFYSAFLWLAGSFPRYSCT